MKLKMETSVEGREANSIGINIDCLDWISTRLIKAKESTKHKNSG